MTLPFLPEAVQTERQGELSVRVKIKPSELPALRVSARKAGIVYRTVVVTVADDRTRDQYWVFSKAPIPNLNERNNHLQKRRKGPVAP